MKELHVKNDWNTSDKRSAIENAAGTVILLAIQKETRTQNKQRNKKDERQTIITIGIHLKDKSRFIYFDSFDMYLDIWFCASSVVAE